MRIMGINVVHIYFTLPIFIIKMGKVKYIWTTLIPMILMSVITLTAAHQLFWGFIKKAGASDNPAEVFTFRLDAILMGIMALLSVVIVIDSVIKWYGYINQKSEVRSQKSEAIVDS